MRPRAPAAGHTHAGEGESTNGEGEVERSAGEVGGGRFGLSRKYDWAKALRWNLQMTVELWQCGQLKMCSGHDTRVNLFA